MAEQLASNTSFLENGTLHAPWKSLKAMQKRLNLYTSSLGKYVEETERATDLIDALHIEQLEQDLQRARARAENAKLEQDAAKAQSNDLLNDSEDVLSEIRKIKQTLEGTISTLHNFGKSHVSTKEALKQAREIMRLINNIAKGMKYPNEEVLKKCTHIHHLVGKMAVRLNTNTSDIKADLRELKDKLSDLENNLLVADEITSLAHSKNRHNQMRFDKLNEIASGIDETDRRVQVELKQTNKLVKDSLKNINSTLGYNDELLRDEELGELIDDLQERDAAIATFDSGKLLQPVLNHVAQLEKNSSEYGRYVCEKCILLHVSPI